MDGKSETGSNYLKRMKTMKHPYILQFKGGLERDDTTIITTESVIPLHVWIQRQSSSDNESQIVLGFSQILDALQFLNEDCGLVHGNVTPNSIYVNASGDWKLGGLDLLSEYDCPGATPSLWITNPRFVSEKFQDPERRSGRWKGGATKSSSDVYVERNRVFTLLLFISPSLLPPHTHTHTHITQVLVRCNDERLVRKSYSFIY